MADADLITLDPAATASDRTPLDLSGPYAIRSADYGNAAVEQAMAQMHYGETPVGFRLPNREVQFELRIQADGVTGIGEAVRHLQQKVALFQSEGGWLGRTLNPTSAGEWGEDVLYAEVVSAELTLPSDFMSQHREVILDAVLTLTCLPDFYGSTQVTTGRTNRCTNPSIETATTGWSANGAATVARSATEALAGGYSLQVTSSTSLYGGTKFSISAGNAETYTASVWIKPSSTSIPMRLRLIDNGTGSATDYDWTPSTTDWQKVSVTHTTASSGIATLQLQVIKNGDATDTVYYVDAVLIEKADSAGVYFDGDGWFPDDDGVLVEDATTRWTGGAHASSSTAGPGAAVGDYDSLVFADSVPGDYPARSHYTFTDTGSQDRQAVLIASQSRTYDPAATAALVYEAENLTPLDAAAVATKSGAHGGASNNAVEHPEVSEQWTPILSTEISGTGHLTHVGVYRLFARVYGDGDVRVRCEYGTGDGVTRHKNKSVTVNGASTFYIKDLGEVRIDKVPVGTQQWEGAIYAQFVPNAADIAAGYDTCLFGIDKLWLAPTESLSIVKARKEPGGAVEVGLAGYTYRSGFNTESGAINGDTSDSGHTWASSGDATDISVGSGVATRLEGSDTSVETGGRYAVLGSAMTATGVQADVQWDGLIIDAPPAEMRFGILARYTDTTKYLMAGFDHITQNLSLFIRASSQTTTLWTGGSSPYWRIVDFAYTLKLTVAVDGTYALYVGFAGPPNTLLTTGQHPALATGGALASGKVGIVDANEVAITSVTRTYDNFAAWTPDADAACFSTQAMEAAFNGAWRETADTGIYAPTHVEGALPRAPASGLEARTCRTLILPSAGDFDMVPDADPPGSFTVAADHSPAYLFVPEA